MCGHPLSILTCGCAGGHRGAAHGGVHDVHHARWACGAVHCPRVRPAWPAVGGRIRGAALVWGAADQPAVPGAAAQSQRWVVWGMEGARV
eukprot:357215-Chlamydomonas_euryale.AAC.5